MLPTKQQAIDLYKNITTQTDRLNLQMGAEPGISGRHYQAVAFCAQAIASYCPDLDAEKAWILGLLHDYGEFIEKSVPHTFHGTAGYDEMMHLGYDEVARVCLTHSFFDNNFNPQEYAYDSASIIRAGKLISQMTLDDYDYLIQISDLMVAGYTITSVEKRLDFVAAKYHLSDEVIKRKKQAALNLKIYFDRKTGKNIYNLTGITSE